MSAKGGEKMLTRRQIEILKVTVEEFIATAEPVGSKTLMNKYHLNYSSATIRNDMQVLENEGYLEKQHTSSGRVPSTKGYRFYCENLLDDCKDEKMELMLDDIFSDRTLNFEDAMDESCRLLASMTNLTTGAIGPDSSSQCLSYIKLFPMSETSAIVVFITDLGHTENRSFNFEDGLVMDDLQRCCDLLNERLKGTPLDQLVDKMEGIKTILIQQFAQADMMYKAFISAFMKFKKEHVSFTATENLMYQPEFNDVNELKQIVTLLKDDNSLSMMANSTQMVLKKDDNNELMWLDNIAIASSKFKINDDEARLMVVGPCRMNYQSVLSMLDYISKKMEEYFNATSRRNK